MSFINANGSYRARMYHYIRQRNLPHLLDDKKKMTSASAICYKIKPKFFKPPIAVVLNLFIIADPLIIFQEMADRLTMGAG